MLDIMVECYIPVAANSLQLTLFQSKINIAKYDGGVLHTNSDRFMTVHFLELVLTIAEE